MKLFAAILTTISILLSGCASQRPYVRSNDTHDGIQEAVTRDPSVGVSINNVANQPNSHPVGGAPTENTQGQDRNISQNVEPVPLGTKLVAARIILGITAFVYVTCKFLAC